MQQGATTSGVKSPSGYLRRACEDCGGEKPKGHGRRVCDPCQAKRKQAYAEKVNTAKRALHPCYHCGGTKEEGNTSRFCLKCISEGVAGPCPKCGRPLPKDNRHCKECERLPCAKCGGPKEPGLRLKYCAECNELVKWQSARRATFRRHKERRCVDCNAILRKAEQRKYCETCKKRRTTRWCLMCKENPTRGVYKKYCETCFAVSLIEKAKYSNESRRLKRRADKQWRERQQARDKKRFQELSQASRDKLNSSRRIRNRLKGNMLPISETAYIRRNGTGRAERIIAAPLIPYLRKAVPGYSTDEALGLLQNLAEGANVDASWLRRVIKGELPTLRLLDADRLCMAMDLMLYDVYGTDIDVIRGMGLDTAA